MRFVLCFISRGSSTNDCPPYIALPVSDESGLCDSHTDAMTAPARVEIARYWLKTTTLRENHRRQLAGPTIGSSTHLQRADL
jgi:hypothetical protein